MYEDGHLRYSGGVGTGFDGAMLDRLAAELATRTLAVCPFDPVPPREVGRTAHWVRPELVAQTAFTEWTYDGILRQAAFLGLRDDKTPADVVKRAGYDQRPVWPKPPPRLSPSSSSTTTSSHTSIGWMSSWATRSPRCTS